MNRRRAKYHQIAVEDYSLCERLELGVGGT